MLPLDNESRDAAFITQPRRRLVHKFAATYSALTNQKSTADRTWSHLGSKSLPRGSMKHAPLGSVQDTEELAYKLLASLPRDRLATIQRRIAPLLQFDLVRSLPTEISLQIFSYLPFQTLITCALVSRRWRDLADDQSLWRKLCDERGWKWRAPPTTPSNAHDSMEVDDSDDEGMGDSGDESEEEEQQFVVIDSLEAAKAELAAMHAELDSGFVSMSSISTGTTTPRRTLYFGDPQFLPPSSRTNSLLKPPTPRPQTHFRPSNARLEQAAHTSPKPNFKLLHQTHIKLLHRFIRSNYRLSPLQTRGAPPTANAHTSTVYCLQLYTYPDSGKQVLFTGSRDKTIREWDLGGGVVERMFGGVHAGSVLSLCVGGGYLVGAGSDRRVGVWRLDTGELVKMICDHEDSVLCVRVSETVLVSCSKDRTVRTYFFPSLEPQFVLSAHRAAVNAVSISDSYIVSASGDRSVKLWDVHTGRLVRTFDAHHTRGIAAIDFHPPVVLSGSSDTHVRMFDIATLQGWSTCPEHANTGNGMNVHSSGGAQTGSGSSASMATGATLDLGLSLNSSLAGLLCQSCGSNNMINIGSSGGDPSRSVVAGAWNMMERDLKVPHRDLVRSVALGDEFVVSGSYDLTIKVWDRKTGGLVADLKGGHTGRIFCVGFDSRKIVSCGEDQRICIWDFSHGIDTSFLA